MSNIFHQTIKRVFMPEAAPTLRILMYHKIDPLRSDALTVSVPQLEEQLSYLQKNGYQFLFINELTATEQLPPKAVLLTFDDAYLNNLEYAYPILKKYGAKATIFVPTAYVGKSSSWDTPAEPLLSLVQLKALDKTVFELGLHSHTHQNFQDSSTAEIRQEMVENLDFFVRNQLPYVPALAYPYGGRPENAEARAAMYAILTELGIKYAFRIGNRLNTWPVENQYEMQRLDVRGTDSFAVFKSKLKWGKWF